METYNILSIDEFKTNIGNKSRLLGIDPGNKNIGLAICDENQIIATPLKTIRKDKLEILLKEISKVIKENHVRGIIIGNPINMDGTSGKSSQSALDFAKNLSTNITIPITLWDERLSSVGALNLTRDINTNTSHKIKNLDKHAAAFILQGAIDYLCNR